MKTACLVARGTSHQPHWAGLFAEGLRRHGWETTISALPQAADLQVFWGIRRQEEIARQKRRGEVCILERGYLGDRFEWTSVSFGGELNGRGEFRGDMSDPSRFDRLFGDLMRPWQTRGGYALLVGQVPTDMSVRHTRIEQWYRDVTAKLTRHGYPVRFRPHPMAERRGVGGSVAGAPTLGGDLDTAFAGASIVVTFNSNTAVESVLAGVPTVAVDIGSMAWPVTSHEVGSEPVTPDRSDWAARLAWKQFNAEEMASGFCWDVVSESRTVAA